MTAWAYMLRCADGSYYVGSTIHLEQRLFEHQDGTAASYTRRRRPVVLVWSEQFPDVAQAFAVEKQVQGWSRAKREALIEGRLEDLAGMGWGHTASRRTPRTLQRQHPSQRCSAGGA